MLERQYFTIADSNLVMVIIRKAGWVIRRWEKWAELTPLYSCVLWELRHILTHLQYYVLSLNSWVKGTVRPDWIGLEGHQPLYVIVFYLFHFWIFEKTSKFWAASYKNASSLLLVRIMVCIESYALFWFGLRDVESFKYSTHESLSLFKCYKRKSKIKNK